MSKYHVFYKRDTKTEQRREAEYQNKMLLDKQQIFDSYQAAKDFAMKELPAYIVKATTMNEEDKPHIRSEGTPYMIVAQHHGKYKHYDYGGGCDWLDSYDVRRASEEELEHTIEQIAQEEHIEKIIAGLELKLF